MQKSRWDVTVGEAVISPHICCFLEEGKEKWQQNFLSSYLKDTAIQYIEVYYRIFISALIGVIF